MLKETMLKITKINHACLASVIALTMGLNSCGEKSMTIPNTTVYSFKHKMPESFSKKRDLKSEDLKPHMDGKILFWGNAIRDANANTFDIGVQFHAETEGRKIFVEKLVLDTPDLKTERIVNEFVEIDVFSKSAKLYFKKLLPFEKINGNSIPLTADYFTLRIDYKLDDKPTKKMSIRFDNTSFLTPIL